MKKGNTILFVLLAALTSSTCFAISDHDVQTQKTKLKPTKTKDRSSPRLETKKEMLGHKMDSQRLDQLHGNGHH